MEIKRILAIEFLLGILLIVFGFFLAWWSRQLGWIEIYPPPWEKQFLESLPLTFWSLGASLAIDGVRRFFSIKWPPSLSKRFLALILYMMTIMLLSLLRGEHFPWPDFDHWKYGFPLFWLIHQTSSFVGAEDKWFIELANFFVNFVFWFPIALFCVCLTLTLIGLKVADRRQRTG